MPIYTYQYLDENGNELDEYVELFHGMTATPFLYDPDTNRPVKKIPFPSRFGVAIDSSKPKTIGALAEKNTERMVKEGKIKPRKEKVRPWWRPKKDKPVDVSGKSSKQIQRYIEDGKGL